MHGEEISNGHEENSVLVVNDEPEQLELMTNLLNKAGYSVLRAVDGLEALAVALREHPDLVISDVSMPRMNGMDFCRQMRADSALKTVPILLVSALQKDTESVIAGLQAGADDYLEIPFNPAHLVAKVARLLERKLHDKKQQSLHRSLQQSVMEWRQTFNAINFPVLIADLRGTIKRSNLAAERIAGLKPDQIIGKTVSDLGAQQPWRKAAELIGVVSSNNVPVAEEVRDATTGKTWAITLYHVHEFGLTGERVILMAQDITRRTELEASLRQSEMMSMLGSLVAGVAHEVRNPLFGISSIVDAFETRFSDRTEYLRYTKVLRDEIGRLTLLMEELLEYGKPLGGDVFLVSAEEMVARSVRACLPAADVAKVTLKSQVADSLPKIKIDRRRLSKVFVNLVENAIQHSPAGGEVTVEARTVTDGKNEWIECVIKDSGRGILEDDLPRIFEPFFSKRRGGTGLGLAIAHRIMQEHGGQLIAGNNPEGGACMIARFPIPAEGDC